MQDRFFETEIIAGYAISVNQIEELKNYLHSQKECNCDWGKMESLDDYHFESCDDCSIFRSLIELLVFENPKRNYSVNYSSNSFLCVFYFKEHFDNKAYFFKGRFGDLIASQQYKDDLELCKEIDENG